MVLENGAKLEARLRDVEGRELGRSANRNKDGKKDAGALITPAKTYNPAADSVLGQRTELVAEKPVDESEETFSKKSILEETEQGKIADEGPNQRQKEEENGEEARG
ncbi:hypothetical protein H6P81_015330 [Aristolochia fimbriata]|uniref:Uncharacterized protein n=1 Tax=Aristolochia fimbriata TaxID=158543 RepID=A0AAV7E4Z9_ARIFI|nr:hypothetical protein H6P81_015330 [Aristolochia fimbriata]